MTSIAAPAVQTAVAQIVARILERVPADADTAPAAAGQAIARTAAGNGRPAANGAPRTGAATGDAPPGPDGEPGPSSPPAGTPPAPAASVILSALLSLANRAMPMDINLTQLLNSAPLQSPLSQLPAELLSKPQVIEAVVLRNTLLPSAPAEPSQPQPGNPLLTALAGDAAAELPTNYRVALQWQNRVLQFISPQPLPTGRTVQLQIDPSGEVLLLPPSAQAGGTATLLQAVRAGAQTLPGNTAPTTNANVAQNAAQVTRPSSNAAATAQTQLPSALLKTPPQQTLQQSLREALPRQQALNTLVPLLQRMVAPQARALLPAPVVRQLQQLLQSLPKAAQLQTGAGVKRALENSGSFLEARIARSGVAPQSAGAAKAAATPDALARMLESDIKAQMNTLLGMVRKLLPDDPTQAGASLHDLDAQADLVYNPKQPLRNNPAAPRGDDVDSGDLQLAQLSKLLQSGLARIQMNQLDGAAARHSSADPQLLVPTWVLELPLPNARGHSDNLQLRIEQHGARDEQQAQKRVQWNVQIAFDLHELGKIAATLAIVDRNVAATVWAERANTHRSVRDKIDYLRAGLESVGVRVTEMQCRLGMPPARSALISQQLVDVHT